MLGKIEGKKTWGQQRMGWLDNITDSMEMCLSKVQEIVEDRGVLHMLHSMGSLRFRNNLVT